VLLLLKLLLGVVVILVPVKLPPQYLIQEYLLLIGGLHIIIKVADLTTASVRQHPLLSLGVIPATSTSPTSSPGEQATVHHFVLRVLTI
jgi:hypothetical protein